MPPLSFRGGFFICPPPSPPSAETVRVAPIGRDLRQIDAMSESPSLRPYRVRPSVENERSVPTEVQAARFHSRDEAENYARIQCRSLDRPMILEKLAPGGCWLQLALVQ